MAILGEEIPDHFQKVTSTKQGNRAQICSGLWHDLFGVFPCASDIPLQEGRSIRASFSPAGILGPKIT